MLRKFFLLCTCFAMSCIGLSVYAINRPIKIKSQPPTDVGTRSILHVPFSLTGSPNSLDILCLADMGTVSVVVQDVLGNVVYEEENVMTYAGSTWGISVEEWALGSYTLSIITTKGAMYQWEFELEEE